MNFSIKIFVSLGACFVMLALIGMVQAQWSQAMLERVTSGPENDHLGYSSLALDDAGMLHLLYDRWMGGGDHDFFYKVKPLGGAWTYNVPIGDPGANLLSPCLAVQSSNGTAYAVYLQNGALRLGIGNLEVWAYYDLPVPGNPPLFHPALSVDAEDRAHVAFILQNPGGNYYIGYGYWDGQFHFQVIANSELGPFGSGAAPAICVTSDGGMAISYRAGTYQMYRVDVAENFSLGMVNWQIQTVSPQNYQCYESSIKAASNDNLYIAYSGDMGWGFPGHVFYAYKPNGSMQWGPSTDITGTFSGVAPKLALDVNLNAHVLFEERSGNILTGNICYATNLGGSWAAQYLQQGDRYNPSLVMDGNGNGSMCFEQYIGTGNQDIYYFGYVEGVSPLPNVTLTLTPLSPPIIIPSTGGSFSFTANLQNNSDSAAVVDVWTEAILPNGSPYGPIINVQGINLPGGGSRSRTFQQFVPASAPAGSYLYIAYAGDYPNGVASTDTFGFTKLGAGDWGVGAGEWIYNELGEAAGQVAMPSEMKLAAHPNPFNPTTAISYQLSADSYVRLQVYDIAGRLVTTLVDGGREGGSHQITWDASGLPSGLYFCRMQAERHIQTQKLLLLK